MFNLTAEEMFQLFYDVCQAHKTSGYPSRDLSRQSSLTQSVWTTFHANVENIANGNIANGSKVGGKAIPVPPSSNTDDYIVAVCTELGEQGQKALYQHLYNLGHRINR